tara:strand:+ start:48 stop:269 length:222 start_codon:yes stop_codon:yes gene_type:complete
MEKAGVFVDGGYSNRILKKYFGTKDIDYLNFSDVVCNKLNVKRLRTYYQKHDGPPSPKGEGLLQALVFRRRKI